MWLGRLNPEEQVIRNAEEMKKTPEEKAKIQEIEDRANIAYILANSQSYNIDQRDLDFAKESLINWQMTPSGTIQYLRTKNLDGIGRKSRLEPKPAEPKFD